MREERDMEKIKIKYLSDKIERLRYIDGKSDWIDLRAAERVELKKGEFPLIGHPLDTKKTGCGHPCRHRKKVIFQKENHFFVLG